MTFQSKIPWLQVLWKTSWKRFWLLLLDRHVDITWTHHMDIQSIWHQIMANQISPSQFPLTGDLEEFGLWKFAWFAKERHFLFWSLEGILKEYLNWLHHRQTFHLPHPRSQVPCSINTILEPLVKFPSLYFCPFLGSSYLSLSPASGLSSPWLPESAFTGCLLGRLSFNAKTSASHTPLALPAVDTGLNLPTAVSGSLSPWAPGSQLTPVWWIFRSLLWLPLMWLFLQPCGLSLSWVSANLAGRRASTLYVEWGRGSRLSAWRTRVWAPMGCATHVDQSLCVSEL